MNMRKYQGWALMISAVIGLTYFINSSSSILKVISIIGTILFIFGVLGINPAQKGATAGLIGVILLELGAVIALAFNFADLGHTVALVSAIAGGVGRLVVGWLTTRRKVFFAWTGWLFILAGLLIMIPIPVFGSVFSAIQTLSESAAEFGYGWGLAQAPK